MFPTIICLWGCSQFIHHVGSIAIDAIYQIFFQKICLNIINDNTYQYVVSARDDYVREEGDEICFLFNEKEMSVHPAVSFIDGAPRVLTCRDHHEDTKQLMIHPC